MSCIHYKFKSSLEYRTVTFEGLQLPLGDLKRMIFERERIRSSDFDLVITDAQSSGVYEGDNAVVLRNSSVVVARIPVENQRKLPKIWDRANEGVVTAKITAAAECTAVSVQKMCSYSDALTEEEKLRKMEEESTVEYDPSKYMKKNAIATGIPPPNYVCNRCNQPGHWIKLCPSLNIKRTTGIPKGELMETTADDPQAMLTASGTYAVPVLHKQAFLKGKAEKPGTRTVSEEEEVEMKKSDVPNELLCTICNGVLKAASLIPCCGYSFCDECIRQHLLESDERECPNCHAQGVSPTTLIPNGKLREAVKALRDHSQQQQPQQQQQQATEAPPKKMLSQSKLKITLCSPKRTPPVDQQGGGVTGSSPSVGDPSADETCGSPRAAAASTPPMPSTSSNVGIMPHLNAATAYPPMYPGMMAHMLPASPFVTGYAPMLPSVSAYATGLPVAAPGYGRSMFAGQSVPSLLSGMYATSDRMSAGMMLKSYPNGVLSMEKTGVDSWDEFLARQDRRRHRDRSSSSSLDLDRARRMRRRWPSPTSRKRYRQTERDERRYRPTTSSGGGASSSSSKKTGGDSRRPYSSSSGRGSQTKGNQDQQRSLPSTSSSSSRRAARSADKPVKKSAVSSSAGGDRKKGREEMSRRRPSSPPPTPAVAAAAAAVGMPSSSAEEEEEEEAAVVAASMVNDSQTTEEMEEISISDIPVVDDALASSGSPKFLEMDSTNVDDIMVADVDVVVADVIENKEQLNGQASPAAAVPVADSSIAAEKQKQQHEEEEEEPEEHRSAKRRGGGAESSKRSSTTAAGSGGDKGRRDSSDKKWKWSKRDERHHHRRHSTTSKAPTGGTVRQGGASVDVQHADVTGAPPMSSSSATAAAGHPVLVGSYSSKRRAKRRRDKRTRDQRLNLSDSRDSKSAYKSSSGGAAVVNPTVSAKSSSRNSPPPPPPQSSSSRSRNHRLYSSSSATAADRESRGGNGKVRESHQEPFKVASSSNSKSATVRNSGRTEPRRDGGGRPSSSGKKYRSGGKQKRRWPKGSGRR